MEREGPAIALMFRGRDALRSKLAKSYRQRFGKTPTASALADALTTLEGEALDADPEAVAIRVAQLPSDGSDDLDGRTQTSLSGVVLDLGDASGQAVVVTPNGYTVVERSPVLFRRTALTGVLPVPAKAGDLNALRGLLNVTDESWPLVVGWLVAACIPDIPQPRVNARR